MDWKQAGLVGGIVAASLILLGLIANAVGILSFNDPRGDDRLSVGASPSEIVTTADPAAGKTGAEPSEPTAAPAGDAWVPLYEHELMHLDNFMADTDACYLLLVDFDSMDGNRFSSPDEPGSDTRTEHTDLVWDGCTGFAENEVSLYSTETSLGSHWAEGTVLNAEDCHADILEYPLALSWVFDPTSPHETWFREGSVLCMVTSDDQVVLGEVTDVASDPDDPTGFRAVFEISLWTRA
ncbi:hypothetical protein GCM10027447_19050 [Glycomyces halotolerans]